MSRLIAPFFFFVQLRIQKLSTFIFDQPPVFFELDIFRLNYSIAAIRTPLRAW